MKMLSKDQMKKIMGGVTQVGEIGNDDQPGCYKCCLKSNPNTCSDCVKSYAGAPCRADSTLESCSGC